VLPFKKILFVCIIAVIACNRYCTAHENGQMNSGREEMSDTEEIELGKKVDEYIRHRFYLENDPELITAVNGILQRLVTVSERKTLPYSCVILQSYSINAFSAPGGHIYVTDGLLRCAMTEDEVAGIVGHEIAHASLKHASKLYGEVMEMISHRNTDSDTSDMLLLLNNHIEEFEQEADSVGVSYAYKAGFDPHGLLNFLERHANQQVQEGYFHSLWSDFYTKIKSRVDHLKTYLTTLKD